MCSVSMVITEGQRLWNDDSIRQWPLTYVPPQQQFDPEVIKKWTEMLKVAKEFDTISEQPDCEDPKKVEWVDKFTDRLTEIGTELIKDTYKEKLGVELIQIAKDIKDTLSK